MKFFTALSHIRLAPPARDVPKLFTVDAIVLPTDLNPFAIEVPQPFTVLAIPSLNSRQAIIDSADNVLPNKLNKCDTLFIINDSDSSSTILS